MSLISGLLSQEIDTISSVTKNQYGDSTTTTEYENVTCRWQERVQRVVGKDNEEIVSTVEVWVLLDYTDIETDWQIEKNDETYIVIATEDKFDLGGQIDHIKLYLV